MNKLFLFWMALTFLMTACLTDQTPVVSIVTDSSIGDPVQHGLSSLTASLEKQNISFEKVSNLEKANGKFILVCGLFEGKGTAATLVQESGQPLRKEPEALAIWKTTSQGKPVWVVNGSDARGLMYGLLDVAERIPWSTDTNDPFSEVVPLTESPDVITRAISLYTMNRTYWESRFYNEDYWAAYMDMLAKNRFNCLVVIFGYENGGFLAPAYPYFFNVSGFPEIKMGNITSTEQEKNLAALKRMIDMAHERGLDFKVGIWDHIYRGGVQAGGVSKEEWASFDKGHLVQGVDSINIPAYTKEALTKFMQLVPELDGIQFRMHNESGLKRGKEMELFWTEVFHMIKASSPDFQIDLRAKELPESIIQVAIDLDLNFRITTKYWMEQMGLPFHPTHINRENQFDRRHGYADMLAYPERYKLHWRLWTGGTQRILLWGNPQYVQRFVASTHLYKGEGFEINEPLATKMEAQDHTAEPFNLLNAPYVYYKYEFERYWHYYQLYGRLGYNPATSPEIWNREFDTRFGNEAGELVQEALHKASMVLPMIVAACSPAGKFPTTRGWPEKQRYGDLPEYASAEGSDIQQFASFDTGARILIEGGETAKRLPSETSAWFARTSSELNQLIDRAGKLVNKENKEFFSSLTDLKIVSNLALYHSFRIPAAVSYRLYKRTGDPHALDDAIRYEEQAIAAWQNIVEAASDVYFSNLMFGVNASEYIGIVHHLSGHWADELAYLEMGLEKLQSERNTYGEIDKPRTAPAFKAVENALYESCFQVQHQHLKSAPTNSDITIQASINAPVDIKWVRLRYRSVNQHLDYQSLAMQAEEGSSIYKVTVPAKQIDPKFDFMYFIEIMDVEGNACMYPDLEVETPYIVVELDREGNK